MLENKDEWTEPKQDQPTVSGHVEPVVSRIYCNCEVGKCEGAEYTRCAFKHAKPEIIHEEERRILQDNIDMDCIMSRRSLDIIQKLLNSCYPRAKRQLTATNAN